MKLTASNKSSLYPIQGLPVLSWPALTPTPRLSVYPLMLSRNKSKSMIWYVMLCLLLLSGLLHSCPLLMHVNGPKWTDNSSWHFTSGLLLARYTCVAIHPAPESTVPSPCTTTGPSRLPCPSCPQQTTMRNNNNNMGWNEYILVFIRQCQQKQQFVSAPRWESKSGVIAINITSLSSSSSFSFFLQLQLHLRPFLLYPLGKVEEGQKSESGGMYLIIRDITYVMYNVPLFLLPSVQW